MDCIVHRVAKSQTQLSNFHFHFHMTLKHASNWPYSCLNQKSQTYRETSQITFCLVHSSVKHVWSLGKVIKTTCCNIFNFIALQAQETVSHLSSIFSSE